MPLFSTPLSGLNASSTALQAISNNLANLNTDGYKAQSAVFSDLFYQNLGTSGNADPIQVGSGTQVEGFSEDLTNGPISATSISSNMALNGPGYFITTSPAGATSYTRAGDFTTNVNGQLTTLSGNLVMGYPVIAGAVSTNSSLQPMNVGSGNAELATPTTAFTLTTNLNSATAPNGTYTPAPVDVYDSLGQAHLMTVTYTNVSPGNWNYSLTMPAADFTPANPPSVVPVVVGSGSLAFNAAGGLTTTTNPTITNPIAFSDGASTMTATWNLTDASGGPLISQTASASSNSATSQNGYAAGTLSSFAVLTDGTIQGTFSSGQTHAIGQIAVANFANVQGLALTGGNQYTPTSGSGQAVVGVAGTGGLGTIEGGSVEQSNVDVATELSDLIVAQRSYEANAKAITTFDQVEQATIQMVA